MGVYPMLQNETCFFLAADFDKASWYDDVAAFLCVSTSIFYGSRLPLNGVFADFFRLFVFQCLMADLDEEGQQSDQP